LPQPASSDIARTQARPASVVAAVFAVIVSMPAV
jgi:hypothetical protein